MATPQELIAIDDAKKAKAKAIVVAKKRAAKGPANDNDVRRIEEPPLADDRPPDGYLECDGVMQAYWLGPPKEERATA